MDADDDSIMLNFASSGTAGGFVPGKAPARKGGKWKDRLKDKRKAEHAAKKRQRGEMEDGGDAKDTNTASSAPKRAKPASQAPQTKPINGSAAQRATSTLKSGSGNVSSSAPVISSLFSSNPVIKALEPQNSMPQKAGPASNAPLKDTSSFEGLGLDPLLVHHLHSKLNVQRPTSIQRMALPFLLGSSASTASNPFRDVFIQSQTGSGKTLTFLLPVIQTLLPLCSESFIDRSIGTLAIVLAPTRELAKQIYDVLERLLNMSLSLPKSEEQSAEEDSVEPPRRARWIVPGLLTGGTDRNHEKARLRKGCPIVVATPGRLLDHLQNSSSFDVSKCRWLVLDEADRLMELGFEETINGIVKALDGRRRIALTAAKEAAGEDGEMGTLGVNWWEGRRRTVLCSATIREDVQVLAGQTLVEPVILKATAGRDFGADTPKVDIVPASNAALDSPQAHADSSTAKFTPPSQLTQKYVIVPAKLRLVTLLALLRSVLQDSGKQKGKEKGTRIIVFLSCTDSVDFHWKALGGATMSDGGSDDEGEAQGEQNVAGVNGSDEEDMAGASNRSRPTKGDQPQRKKNRVAAYSQLIPHTPVYRLHGSLSLAERMESLNAFTAKPKRNVGDKGKGTSADSDSSEDHGAILLCTSVASRGLDLPLVRCVIQYDLPTEGGATEYVHRVGRTARVGKGGEAWSFVLPSEEAWVSWIEEGMGGAEKETFGKEGEKKGLVQVGVQDAMRRGFGGRGDEYEARATDVQLAFERWVVKNKDAGALARRAFLSHIRAYATHPSNEKHIFHVRNLHLGHLAKAFALREAPGNIKATKASAGQKDAATRAGKKKTGKAHKNRVSAGAASDDSSEEDKEDVLQKRPFRHKQGKEAQDAESRMYAKVRMQGKLTKRAGVLGSFGGGRGAASGEFQTMGLGEVEKLLAGQAGDGGEGKRKRK